MGHVLVIDDDPTFRRVVCRAIEQDGFRVVEARRVRCVAMARNSLPAHFAGPENAGGEWPANPSNAAVRWPHRLHPVIIVSPPAKMTLYRETVRLGAVGFLYKTHFSVPDLRTLVKQHMSGKNASAA